MAFPLAAILTGAQLLGKILGGGAKKSAEGRRDDAYQDANLAAINNSAQINAAQHNLTAPSVLAKRGIGAAGLMNYAPTGAHGGGKNFAASLQDPAIRDAILKRMVGDSGQQLRTRSYAITPQTAQRAKPGMLEKIGGFGGLLGGLAGGMRELGLGGRGDDDDPVGFAQAPKSWKGWL